MENPVWHIHSGVPKATALPVTFTLLLNLAAVCLAEEPSVVWRYVSEYAPGVTAKTHPELDRLIGYAVNYYQDLVRPNKTYRLPTKIEAAHITALLAALNALADDAQAEAIQSAVYATGKAAGYENLREWFQCLYEVLLGQSEGPRMGSFFALYGREKTRLLLTDAIAGKLADEAGAED